MYTFKIGLDPAEHDEYVKTHPLAILLQSSAWAKVKDNWESELVGVYENKRLVASAQVLIRKLILGVTMLYLPRGPIMDYTNEFLVKFMMKHLRLLGKSRKALFVKMDPAIKYRAFKLGEEEKILTQAENIIQVLQNAGTKWQGLTKEMADTVQPRFQANVYQEDFSEEQLSKKTKQMLCTARKKGVMIKKGGLEFVSQFAEIMKKTEKRKGVLLRGVSYYEKLLQTFPKQAFIMLAELNLQELYKKTQVRYQENEQALAKLKENQVKKRRQLEELQISLERELTELQEKKERFGAKVIIAGTLTIVFAKTSEILYAGMDESYKRYMPAYLTWFTTLQEAFAQGATTSNLGGLEASLNDGLLKFKNNFNPTIEEFIGEFDLPANKFFFTLSQWAYKMKKHRRKKG
ncbi:MAG: aminoacyltransferase [Streptococcaceae bacterium]|jgi:serine/alanine adding enzyme|nr:aminoacyltransferase [Streptococcaceae bacterium]